jgi:hypothetical protein
MMDLLRTLSEQFGFHDKAEFFRSYNLNIEDEVQRREGEAMLLSWRTEAAYVDTLK